MTCTLYSRKNTGGLAVEAALAKSGAAYTVKELTRTDQQSPDFRAINPLGHVPAMVMPGGSVMTESAAMVMHLANLYPDAGLAPRPGTPAHGAFLRWMLFMAVDLYESSLRSTYSARYTTDPAGAPGVKAAAAVRMARCFKVIESALDPFVCGKALSIADVYLAMLTEWSPSPLNTAKFIALRKAVNDDPHYGPVWRDHLVKPGT